MQNTKYTARKWAVFSNTVYSPIFSSELGCQTNSLSLCIIPSELKKYLYITTKSFYNASRTGCGNAEEAGTKVLAVGMSDSFPKADLNACMYYYAYMEH
jgi:hypothetical protein